MIKKLICLIGLGAALALPANAASWKEFSFFKNEVLSIQLTNLLNFTNLSSVGISGIGTNVAGMLWTNHQFNAGIDTGTRMLVSATTIASSALDTFNVFQDVPLWVDSTGAPIAMSTSGVTNANPNVTNCFGGILIALNGANANANSAVDFIFSLVPDGVNELTAIGDTWTNSVTAVGTTAQTKFFPWPNFKSVGCKSLRVRAATNTDADATSQVWVTKLSFIGFVP